MTFRRKYSVTVYCTLKITFSRYSINDKRRESSEIHIRMNIRYKFVSISIDIFVMHIPITYRC